MYTREEASRVKSTFWKKYGQYMAPVPSSDWEVTKVNWINYNTGIKNIQFKMDADKRNAYIAIYLLSNEDVQMEIYNTMAPFLQNNPAFDAWVWEIQEHDNQFGVITKFILKIDEVNIFLESSWPKLITFFKENMILLDAFWSEYKFAFEGFKYK